LADSRDAGRHKGGHEPLYHSGQINRTFFTLIMLCGCDRVNGGWTPSYPATGRNPLDLCDEAERAWVPAAEYVLRELRAGHLRFAAETPANRRTGRG
jgi:nitrate reductase alpha subunit